MLLLIKRLYSLRCLEKVIPEALKSHSLHGMASIITAWKNLVPSTVVRGDSGICYLAVFMLWCFG